MANKKTSTKRPGSELMFSYFNELGIVSQLSKAMFERLLPEGLTISQFSVLNWFVRVDSVATPGRLSAAFQVTKGAMTNTLKKLEEKKCITVHPDPANGRKKIVKITRRGKKLRDKAIADAHPLLEEFSINFDVAELELQLSAIQKIRIYLDSHRLRNE